jgi:hypothetical protein
MKNAKKWISTVAFAYCEKEHVAGFVLRYV